MSNKYFQIFERYHNRKYQRDLEELQQEMAERGLAQSGIRDEAEARLLANCRDEIAMEKEKSDTEDEEALGRKKERRNLIIANRILATVAIVAVLIQLIVAGYTVVKAEGSHLDENVTQSIFDLKKECAGLVDEAENQLLKNTNIENIIGSVFYSEKMDSCLYTYKIEAGELYGFILYDYFLDKEVYIKKVMGLENYIEGEAAFLEIVETYRK